MDLLFTKMHGLGNDFIIIDCIKQPEAENLPFAELSKRLCNRRFGIGADQLLLLCQSDMADFKMRIFNADGGEVEMCGNGIRCLAKYIWDNCLSEKNILEIETLAGIIRPEKVDNMVRVDMGMPIFEAEKIPVNINKTEKEISPIIDYPLRILDRDFRMTCLSMGNPHAVIVLSEDISDFPVSLYGPEIEKHPIFPKKTNVEFINIKNKRELAMRVWERGAGETLACGTGASAAAVAAMLKGLVGRATVVHLLGGDLHIEWADNNHVYMTGSAEAVFEGTIKGILNNNPNQDRRRLPRTPYNASFEYTIMGKKAKTFKPGVSCDVSESGIGIVSESAIEPGQIIFIRPTDNSDDLKAAVVKWSMKIGNKYRAGLMFIDSTDLRLNRNLYKKFMQEVANV